MNYIKSALTLCVLFGVSSVHANDEGHFNYYLDEVEVVESVQATAEQSEKLDFEDCVEFVEAGFLDEVVSLSKIINVGIKVWALIEKNKPVVNINGASANAIPQGLRCWQSLENWSSPHSVTYRYKYKNLYGVTVVDFEFKLTYTYGGQYNGAGKYLTNVQLTPTKLDVAWGYTFNATAQTLEPVNLGATDNPVAGLESQIRWTIDTVVKHSEQTVPLFVDGFGNVKSL